MQFLTEKDITTLNVYVINKYSPNEKIGRKTKHFKYAS